MAGGNSLINMLGSMGNGGPMQNNPIMQIINMARNGGNPMSMLTQIAGNNPQAKQVIDMMSSGNQAGLKEMAMNMAKERGTSIEDVAKNLGIEIPK